MEGDGEPCAKDDDAAAKKKRVRKKKKNKGVKEEPDDVEEDWVDITAMCDLATQGMHAGEMIESPHFRLFDAMSAIEIMDPKMDSGYNNSADMTLERAMETGIISKKMSHEELVGVWDQLLMYYMLWLEGHTLVQTCFCCLYLQDLEAYVKPVPLLGEFVDAFLLACRRARSAIWTATVFDDEDFLPSLFSFDLEAYVYSSKQSEILARIKKACKTLEKDSSPQAEDVASRLEFMGEYAAALSELHDAVAPSAGQPPERGSIGAASLETAQRRLTSCLRLLEKLSKSARPPPPEVLRAFDPSVNRHLLVPGPPRTVVPISDPQVAFGMWRSHLNELLRCGNVAQRPLAQLFDVSTCREDPNVLARSLAQITVSEDGLLRRLMLDSLELFLFPREALQHCKKSCDNFLEHSESLFSHLLRLAHVNSARRFRRLAHVFGDFNALQHEAWGLDEDLKHTFGANLRHPRPCWIWVMEHCLQAMLTKLFLGFELDLYDEAEFHMIYWYADYLFGLRIYNFNDLYYAKEQPVGGGGKRRTKPQPQKPGQRPRNPPPAMLLLEGTQHVVRGLFRLLAYCLRRGYVSSPPAIVEGLAQRFVLRFRSLEHFRLPHLPSFRDFQQSAASAQAPADSRFVLEAAQSSFAEASQLLEKFTAVFAKEKDGVAQDNSLNGSAKGLRRVVVANQLAITQLMQGLSNGKEFKISTAATHHPHLLSVQVQSVTAASS
mmetsp:Transcript_23748/g.66039  ORF Transcript_23748/g.66039 Transcript_23748/m.66039 type:complete len:720 (+) Transcript_23748:55-2214(+)